MATLITATTHTEAATKAQRGKRRNPFGGIRSVGGITSAGDITSILFRAFCMTYLSIAIPD
jgi:hypothetical protein